MLVFCFQCDPNSYVVGVYYENLDPKMPLLALFASRNIHRGEEITFNYNGQTEKTSAGKIFFRLLFAEI